MDEDKRELLEYQERFLENGDLEADKETRKRKFKWKHVESTWINNVMDSDDNDDENAQDETFEYKPLQLKQLTSLLGETHQDGTSSNGRTADRDEPKAGTSQGSNPASSQADTSLANGSFFSKHIRTIRREMVSGPSGDIQSYIIKDKNLVKAMSLKRPNETGMKDANKRARTDARTKTKSIFDVFQF